MPDNDTEDIPPEPQSEPIEDDIETRLQARIVELEARIGELETRLGEHGHDSYAGLEHEHTGYAPHEHTHETEVHEEDNTPVPTHPWFRKIGE